MRPDNRIDIGFTNANTHKLKQSLVEVYVFIVHFQRRCPVAPSTWILNPHEGKNERIQFLISSSHINRTSSLLLHCSLRCCCGSSSNILIFATCSPYLPSQRNSELWEIGGLLTARRLLSYPYHDGSFLFHQAIVTSFRQCQTWESLTERNTQDQDRHLMLRTLITFW